MNIMVTGGAGFVGTNLIKRLLKDGHNVVSLDNYSTGTEDNHQEGCKYVDADIRDVIDFSYYMEKPDVIYHLAAIARIQPSFKNPANTLEVGILGTINILEWAREIDCKVIFAGSSSVHSGKLKNPYTFSKVVADDLCLLYKKHFDLDASICRFYNVYGPHQLTEGEYCTVVGIFERQYENGEPLTITGDGFQRRDFTHIDDIVNGLILTMDSIFSPDIIELGRGNNYSINELASMFKTEIEYIDERPGEARETLCDISNAHREIGYEPEVDLEDYISGVIGE
jgi:UDP-glucose 4-epimerase|tara:strand:- start:1849 stop:2697 length:849 start_codon:yes stop_codon:yes gene_type:complete